LLFHNLDSLVFYLKPESLHFTIMFFFVILLSFEIIMALNEKIEKMYYE